MSIRNELSKFPWVKVYQAKLEWNLIPSETYAKNYRYVTEKDFRCAVERIFREVARKLQVPYEEIKDILYEENKGFFENITGVFNQNGCSYSYRLVSPKLTALKEALRVPDVSIPLLLVEKKAITKEEMICYFNQLSFKDKIWFLEEIGLITLNEKQVEEIK